MTYWAKCNERHFFTWGTRLGGASGQRRMPTNARGLVGFPQAMGNVCVPGIPTGEGALSFRKELRLTDWD
jgi:hypothetical protein